MNRDPEDRLEISQHTEISGGHNQIDSINQIGAQNNFYGTGTRSDPEELDFDAKWSWKSPLTQAVLGWVSVFLSIFSAASFYRLIRLALGSSGDAPALTAASSGVWLALFACCLVALLLALAMWRIVRLRLHAFTPISFLPVATESEGHFAVAKYEGTCRTCDGKLRFYKRPVEWKSVPAFGGGTRDKVTKRVMAAECRRNPEHWWKLDPTDVIV